MILLLAAAFALSLDPDSDAGAALSDDGGGYVEKLDACEAAALSDPGAADILAWTRIRESNRLEDYRGFPGLYPQSPCAARAKEIVETREETARRWATDFAHEPDKGPKPAYIIGDPSFGIMDMDYPATALRNGEEGTVGASYDIATDGEVENCQVTQSSGSPTLDRTSCMLITRNGRYKPARDADGRPIRSHGSRHIVWRIPRGTPPPQPAGH